jgi:sarcosine oxidase, subunit gamma
MADGIAVRRSVLDGLALPSHSHATVKHAGAVSRFIYRGPPDLAAAAFAVELPTVPMRSCRHGDRAALWLGPDEWLLLAPEAEGAALAAALSSAVGDTPASLVDVSHRQVGLVVAGPRAEQLLNAGCPLDLGSADFPIGMCTRTILAKVEIVLLRTHDDVFRVEVARSFAPYVVAFLAEAMHAIA